MPTPGLHSGGQFHFTNNPEPSNDWHVIWLGFADKPMVVGRFDDSRENECIGVINDSINPTSGDTRFALYYWCDMMTAPGAGQLLNQFLSGPLTDSQGFSGTHQFIAGDWDGDGIDTIAVRRDIYITYSNIHPAAGSAAYANSQYWGSPANAEGVGTFVSGDWDGDGVDGWGVLYSNGNLYYRNNLEWNPGTYSQKILDIEVDPTSWSVYVWN